MKTSLLSTAFRFPNQTAFYKGKVRDVYTIDNTYLVIVATDRISAFDVVMPYGIPYKGQVLNQIASRFLKSTSAVAPNWLLSAPDPNVAIGLACKPFKVEMVIRGYLSGHSARVYASGERTLCGNVLPEGLKDNDKLPQPIITPTTKADIGLHDQDISKADILQKGLVSEQDYSIIEAYTHKLFEEGTKAALERGLILVDTKYEFGKSANGNIVLIDEIHTPDSSRYFYAEGYLERQERGESQKQLSKEFFRQWLVQNGFRGQANQKLPIPEQAKIEDISERYIELYGHIMGEPFTKKPYKDIHNRIENEVLEALKKL